MYQRTVLPNGIRIVTEYVPYVRSVSLGVWFETGSRDEQENECGLAHFIEHMMFKGSERYSAREIAEIIDHCGGHINAFTGKEHTCFYVRVLDEDFGVAADVLCQMLKSPLLDDKDIIKERSVVLEELKMYEDSPDDMVHDLFSEVLWPQHALGRGILGRRETVSSFQRSDLVSFIERFYTTDRMVIATAGNIPHAQIVDEVASQFEGLPQGPIQCMDSPRPSFGQTLVKAKDTEQVHLCLGGPALARSDPRKSTLYLLDTITGGGMSSLLFQELREERGLVYDTFSYHSSYRDTGHFGVYAGFSPENTDEVIEVIVRVLGSMGESLSDAVVERAKGQLKGGVVLSLESMSNRMTRLAKNEISLGRIVPTDELISEIENVTKEQVFTLGRELYKPENWSIAAIGPVEKAIREDILCQKTC